MIQPEAAEHEVRVTAGSVTLEGNLGVPPDAQGVVLFAHGSGSSRRSSRNRLVARLLREGGLATLLIDLLTPEEEAVDFRTRQLRFDIGLLAERLAGAAAWLGDQQPTRNLRVGCFGASTGGGAALVAAAAHPEAVQAVVSRGGRPDLAGAALAQVQAPTLLIVGGADLPVIPLNEQALAQLRCEKELVIVPGATHLFEEPGALEEVARLTRDWFLRHLGPAPHAGRDGGDPAAHVARVYETPGGFTDSDNESASRSVARAIELPERRRDALQAQIRRLIDSGCTTAGLFNRLNRILQPEFKGGAISHLQFRDAMTYAVQYLKEQGSAPT